MGGAGHGYPIRTACARREPERSAPEERDALDRQGYFAREGVLSAAECAAMGRAFDRLSAAEGDRGGHEVHVEPTASRVSDIFNKTDAFDHCLELPSVSGGVVLPAR